MSVLELEESLPLFIFSLCLSVEMCWEVLVSDGSCKRVKMW